MLRRLTARLRGLVRGRARTSALDDEIRFHLSEDADEHEAEGLTPEEAYAAARRDFGSPASVREHARDAWIPTGLQALQLDLRFAGRLMARERWFVLVAVLTLGVAVGANVVLFAVINTLVLGDPAIREPHHVMAVWTDDGQGRRLPTSAPDFEDWRRLARLSTLGAIYDSQEVSLADDDRRNERARAGYVSANLFQVIGLAPVLGRGFTAADDRPGAPAVVVIGHRLWQTRYAGDASALGRVLRVNGVPATVVGVMPPGVWFPNNVTAWIPLAQLPPDVPADRRDTRFLRVYARLTDSASFDQARDELASIGLGLARAHPATNANTTALAAPLREQLERMVGNGLMIVQAIPILMLLIAGANVSALLLVRTARRAGELAVRAALGAGRWRIVRQLLVESLLLAALAGLVGFGLSIGGVRILANVMRLEQQPLGLPYDFEMDPVVFGLLAATSAVVVLFGLAPALLVSRTNLCGALQEGGGHGRRGAGRRIHRWTGRFVAAELAMTLALLATAGLMVRSLQWQSSLDLGVDPAPLLTMRVSMWHPRYAAVEEREDLFRQLEDQLPRLPGVEAASMASYAPYQSAMRRRVVVAGDAVPADEAELVTFLLAGDDYFDTLGVGLVRGRTFAPPDGRPGQETAIVNRRFAAVYFPDEDPVGHRIQLHGPSQPRARPFEPGAEPPAVWATIVGIVPDVRQLGRAPEQTPVVYMPHRSESPRIGALLVRARAGVDPVTLIPAIQQTAERIDPDLAFFNVWTLDALLEQGRRAETRLMATVLSVFALASLLLSATGLYAVTAYAVTQRVREIGVRMALGARTGQVEGFIVRLAARQVIWGLVLGLSGAIAAGQLMRGVLTGVTPTDPVTWLGIVAILVTVALLSAMLPARQAARIDPLVALRQD